MLGHEGLPWDHPGVYAITTTAARADCDLFNHVNNAVYVAWQDRVAWAHSTHLGFPIAAIIDLGIGYVVQENRAQYLRPVQLGDTLALGTWIIEADQRLRCVRAFQFIRLSDQKTVFRGQITYVTFDLKRQRPSRTPPPLQHAFQRFKRDPS